MDNSPFNRSGRTARSPPPAHSPALAPVPEPPPRPKAPAHGTQMEIISTPEIQNWLTSIEQYLNEVCTIAAEGKLNSEQKLRIHNLCRKVGHGTSQLAVQYQSLKCKAVQAQSSLKDIKEQLRADTDLTEQLKDIQVSIKESAKPTAGSTFADMVKRSSNNYIQPTKTNSVAIYPNDKLQSSDDTKLLVQKIICPEQMQLQVRGLRKTKNGGVIISTDRKEDINKLKMSEQLKKSGLVVDEPQKRKPRIVIVGVPSSMQEKDVFTCLYQQNLAENIKENLDHFLLSIRLSHKSGRRNAETCNFVVEVPATIRKALITKERVFINWSSCPVRDFTLVTRCYKCQQYGHAAKSCRETNYTCGHCAAPGHSAKDCTKKAENPACATCLHFKKPSNHVTGAADCPAKLLAKKRYISSIDYDGA